MFYVWNQFCGLLRRLRRLEMWVSSSDSITYVSAADGSVYDLQDGDRTVVVDTTAGPVTINLIEGASIEGRRLTFKRIPVGGNDLILDAPGSDLIDQNATMTITNDYAAISMRATTSGYILTAEFNM